MKTWRDRTAVRHLASTLDQPGKDRLRSLMRYRFFSPEKKNNLFIYHADGKYLTGGLTDRLKGIISAYAFCKATGLDFRIYHPHPFDLEQYLLPAQYDWRISSNDLSDNYFEVHLLNTIGDGTLERFLQLPTGKQVHFYGNRDVMPLVNAHFNTRYMWGELFHELFTPAPELAKHIAHYREKLGAQFIALHIRFLNLLGDRVEIKSRTLSEEKRDYLIQLFIREVRALRNAHTGKKVLLNTDSEIFRRSIAAEPGIIISEGDVVHFDNVPAGVNQDAAFLKVFLDFLLMSYAEKIFSVRGYGMVGSEFYRYAAYCGDVPLIRHMIEIDGN